MRFQHLLSSLALLAAAPAMAEDSAPTVFLRVDVVRLVRNSLQIEGIAEGSAKPVVWTAERGGMQLHPAYVECARMATFVMERPAAFRLEVSQQLAWHPTCAVVRAEGPPPAAPKP